MPLHRCFITLPYNWPLWFFVLKKFELSRWNKGKFSKKLWFFLKFIISVRGRHFDYLPQVPKNITVPLFLLIMCSHNFPNLSYALKDGSCSFYALQLSGICNWLWNTKVTLVNAVCSGFGGLEVACWPLVPKFAGSNPAEAVGFFRAKKSSARLPSEGK